MSQNLLFIEKRIQELCKKNNFTKLLIAVSGGADSTALLSSLSNASPEIIACHCNFNLRGEESKRDEIHVKKLCEKLSVKLLIKEFDVKGFLKTNKANSIEMACRKLRYDWFMELKIKFNTDRIVTGHNADDNIETLFLNLLRGSGTSGLKGMTEDNGTIWRPLLFFHRDQILDYLKSRNLDFVIDSSNLKNDYRRNYIRNEVIPLLKKEWKGFNKAMDRSIEILTKENQIIYTLINETLSKYDNFLPLSVIKDFTEPITLIRKFIDPLHPFTTTPKEIMNSILAEKPSDKKWILKKGTVILKHNGLIIHYEEN